MAWEPVLAGRQADAAWAAVRDIADQIMVTPTDRARPEHLTLFWAYAAGAFDDDTSTARYEDAVAQLMARIERGFEMPCLFGGLAGAGWVLAHVNDGGADELLARIDAELVDTVSVRDWRGHHDLITGLVGYGLYFLERAAGGEVAAARAGLERVVGHLAALADVDASGATWRTVPELLPAWQRERFPAGVHDCGVAHGVPGVIAVLGRIAALREPPAGAAPLCAQATAWLRSQRLDPDPAGRFPGMIAGDRRDRTRAAWCYGDPGIAAAVWSAAVRTGAPVDDWRALAADVAARPVERCGVIDAGLCHGATGLGHLCNRYFQASGDPRFRAAAIEWFERALAMRRPGHGIAGWVALGARVGDAPATETITHDLLEGAAGIGLALLTALRSEPPGWDRLLACDIPYRGES